MMRFGNKLDIRGIKFKGLTLFLLFLSIVAIATASIIVFPSIPQNNLQKLYISYPPPQHQTQSDRIFLIGTAATDGEVFINDRAIKRSRFGHFAPTFPLAIGINKFNLKYKNQNINLNVSRLSGVTPPENLGFIERSLIPNVDISRLPNEDICFEAIATPDAIVKVKLANLVIPLVANNQFQLPVNSAILLGDNSPYPSFKGLYRGCANFSESGELGKPEFIVSLGDRSISQKANGNVNILSPQKIELAQVIIESGIARTGAGSDYSRLTPLPKGTIDRITAKEGDWVRLSYGGWIEAKSLQINSSNSVPTSVVRSFKTQKIAGWTELIIPLQIPVPISISQGDRTLILTLHNVTAQTDTNLVNDDPVIARIDWQQKEPNKVEYILNLKSGQQWGYKFRYEGTNLILSLRHPPVVNSPNNNQVNQNPLKNVTILLDPGHGSKEDLGSRGATGYPEKDVTLIVSKLLQRELIGQGAKVIMTRTGDDDLLPNQRAEMIEKIEPAIALSLHYNALPDRGDAENTKGISTFWYNAQSHDLAMFIHNYLVKDLNRSSYGVYWNNLALARPTVAPSVLLELGFMIHPEEFEWIINPKEQEKLAKSLSKAIAQWVMKSSS
jgi:N-acetylmuramoyl-L-alanine amidase